MLESQGENLILVVNDAPDQLELMRIVMCKAGYRVVTAGDGRAGFETAQLMHPDLIISDVTMPVMNGIELCRAIRADDEMSNTPILLVSAMRFDTASVVEGLRSGADDYLEAPYDAMHLVAKVARLVERARIEAYYRDIVEQASDIIFTCDLQGHVTHINKAGARFFGHDIPTLIGMPLNELLGDNCQDSARATDTLSADEAVRATYCPVNALGKRRYLEVVTTSLHDTQNRTTGTRNIARDITERRAAEEALRASEARFSRLSDSNLIGIIASNFDGKITEANDAFLDMVGYAREDLLDGNLNWKNFTAPEYIHLSEQAIEELKLKGACTPFEKDYVRKDGTRVHVLIGVALLEDSPDNCVAFIVDLTERKRAEEQSAQLQAYAVQTAQEWRLTFNAIKFPVMIADFEGKITRVNLAAKELAGIDFREMMGRGVESLGVGQPWRQAGELVRLTRKTRVTQSCQVRDEVNGKTWDITANLVHGVRNEENVILIARDITRRIELETSVRQSQMMSVMGSLVAGVAHEVRNPLFGMSSVLDAFEARFGSRSEYERYTGILREQLNRLNELMEELLEYGKPYKEEFFQGSIEDVIAHSVCSCKSLAESSDVKLVNKVNGHLAPVMMERRRLPKVFMNIIENAIRHSQPATTVTVEVAKARENGQTWIDCTVKDCGPGFKSEDLPRIFEPFFTRRRGGTGLGLSIVQRIVEEHKGTIAVGNRDEGGAFVTVRLPAASAHR